MRITVDLDDKRWWKVLWVVFKGCLLIRKFPDEIRVSATGKGYHIIWRNVDVDHTTMLRYRKIIGDDRNRIKLDAMTGRVTQVLFKKKTVKYYRKRVGK